MCYSIITVHPEGTPLTPVTSQFAEKLFTNILGAFLVQVFKVEK